MLILASRNYTTDWARSTGGRSLGVVMTDGKQWLGQKLFTVKQLRNFGFGKTSLVLYFNYYFNFNYFS